MLLCRKGSIARRRLVMGLASGLGPSRSTFSTGRATVGTTGDGAATGRGGGGSASVKDCFLRRKKAEVFFWRVCVVVGWWDSREGGAEDFECDLLTVVSTEVEDT